MSGVTDHITLINHLIIKNNYERYLEIGCAQDECFNQIKAKVKVGVDPKSGGTVRLTSDDYFGFLDPEIRFDLIFIDGLHHSEQVDRDIANSLRHLNPNGIIVVHDCLPTSEAVGAWPYANTISWTGDVWKAIVAWRTKQDVDICVIDFDWGCGLIKMRANSAPLKTQPPVLLTWDVFTHQKRELLNIKTWPQAETWLNQT